MELLGSRRTNVSRQWTGRSAATENPQAICERGGEQAPWAVVNLFSLLSCLSLPTLCTSFLQEYKEVFEPLLLEECAAQLLRGNDEGQVAVSEHAVTSQARAL
jgi:hypothetical protein